MKKKILIVLLIFVSIIILTGCILQNLSSNDKVNTKDTAIEKEKVNLVGLYSLIKLKSEKQNYTKKDLSSLKKYGTEVTLELKKDKTAILNIFGDKKKLQYNQKYFFVEGEKVPFTYTNGKMVFSESGQTLIFEKEKELK